MCGAVSFFFFCVLGGRLDCSSPPSLGLGVFLGLIQLKWAKFCFLLSFFFFTIGAHVKALDAMGFNSMAHTFRFCRDDEK